MDEAKTCEIECGAAIAFVKKVAKCEFLNSPTARDDKEHLWELVEEAQKICGMED